MGDVLMTLWSFVVGSIITMAIMWQDVTTLTYEECNLTKPSGTVCVVEYGYTPEEQIK